MRQFDYSLDLPGQGRFRVNSFHQRATPRAAFRAINHFIPRSRSSACHRRASG
jgi:Tfp pilus assembly pilus retraction ATPase PilT